jgi:hypothetical protein
LRNTQMYCPYGCANRILTVYGKLINQWLIRSYADVRRNWVDGYFDLHLYGDVENHGRIQHNTTKLLKQWVQMIVGEWEIASTVVIGSWVTIDWQMRIVKSTYTWNSHGNKPDWVLQQNGETFWLTPSASVIVQHVRWSMTIDGWVIHVQQNINAIISWSLERLVFLSWVHEVEWNTTLTLWELLVLSWAELRNTQMYCPYGCANRILTVYGNLINQWLIRSYADVRRNWVDGYFDLHLYGDVENHGRIQHNTLRFLWENIKRVTWPWNISSTLQLWTWVVLYGIVNITKALPYSWSLHGNLPDGQLLLSSQSAFIEEWSVVTVQHLRWVWKLDWWELYLKQNINAIISWSLEHLVFLSWVHEVEWNTTLALWEVLILSWAELRNTQMYCPYGCANRILTLYGKLINQWLIRSYADVRRNWADGYLEPRIYGELINYGTLRHMSPRIFGDYRGPGTTWHLTMIPAIVPVTWATEYRLRFVTVTWLLVTWAAAIPEIAVTSPTLRRQWQRSISAYNW